MGHLTAGVGTAEEQEASRDSQPKTETDESFAQARTDRRRRGPTVQEIVEARLQPRGIQIRGYKKHYEKTDRPGVQKS